MAIHEVDADSHMDTSSESSGADANDAIMAAGMQIAAYNAQQDNFIAALNNTVCPCGILPIVVHMPGHMHDWYCDDGKHAAPDGQL